MSNVLYRVTKYMNMEDALLAREEKPKKRERQEDVWQVGDRRWLGPENGWRTGA